MSQELALLGDSSVPQELLDCRPAMDGGLLNNPLSRAEVKQLQIVSNTVLNDLGKNGLCGGNAALSLDQLSDYVNYIMRLHASTEIIFEELRRQLKEEVLTNELENANLVQMHSLYRAREERVNAETQASTCELQKCVTKLLFMAGRCERQILACFKLGADQVLQALGSPVEAAFSTVTVDSIYTNTATIQASIHQLLEQSDHRTFGTELLLEEVKLIILQCTAVMKRIHSLSDGDMLPLASDKEPETASEPVISEVKQLPRDPTMLEEYSLVFSRMLDFISESVNRKKQLCDDFKELVDLLGETEPGISKKSPQSSQSVPQVMQEMISIRQLLQKLSIDLAGTQLQRAKVFIQLDQDLVTWVSAVLLKLCKIDEYASTTLIKDIEGRPGNRDEDTLQQARPGCSHKSNSTNCLKRQSAAQFREDKHSEYLPRLRSQADVVNCKNQLTERISLSNDVCTKVKKTGRERTQVAGAAGSLKSKPPLGVPQERTQVAGAAGSPKS
ncbi:unnamed protein product [Schistocephalus solidus]|uniref:Cilia- and flagella-associated protein 206 n=1 Tax=Schistocephalus solidus TaxID=70667 RepID=A0A183TB72_SCHSO|nr:unnamed protein product [Schistocephalus solidus]